MDNTSLTGITAHGTNAKATITFPALCWTQQTPDLEPKTSVLHQGISSGSPSALLTSGKLSGDLAEADDRAKEMPGILKADAKKAAFPIQWFFTFRISHKVYKYAHCKNKCAVGHKRIGYCKNIVVFCD